jgi:hypothetical protein
MAEVLLKMEHQNLSKSFYEGGWEKRENIGGDEPNQVIIYVFMEMLQ